MKTTHIVTPKLAYTLYLCHSLSTWNARMYEFAAVLFTATAFPQNLVASSIFGMIMSLSIFFFASTLGTWIDRAPSRLTTLSSTIIANRISVVVACICWLGVVGSTDGDENGHATAGNEIVTKAPEGTVPGLNHTLFVIIIIFSVVERLSRTANLISIERDWIPTLFISIESVEDTSLDFGLAQVNAAMSRIDLVCKLLAPIAMSAFVSTVGSMRVTVAALIAINVATITLEIASARMVFNMSDRLKAPKEQEHLGDGRSLEQPGDGFFSNNPNDSSPSVWTRSIIRIYQAFDNLVFYIKIWLLGWMANLRIYFAYPVWIPSVALCMLHFSILNYSATLTVYLLSSGFSVNVITIAKALSAVWEIGSTFVYPFGVRMFGSIYSISKAKSSYRNSEDELEVESATELLGLEDSEGSESDIEERRASTKSGVDMGVAHVGLWGLVQMLVCLIPAAFALWSLSISYDPSKPPPTHSRLTTIILLCAIPLSRFGRWSNHLATQQLTQTLVPANHRSAFAGAELGLVSLFGMGHWVVTAMWSRHEQFKWLAAGSVGSVYVSFLIFWWWLRMVKKGKIPLN